MSDNERPVHEAARAQINKALGRYGWKFVESCMAGPVTVKYTIERESDGRRASTTLGIEELTMNILDDVFHEPLAAAGVKLEVSMYLLLTLVRLAKSENARSKASRTGRWVSSQPNFNNFPRAESAGEEARTEPGDDEGRSG